MVYSSTLAQSRAVYLYPVKWPSRRAWPTAHHLPGSVDVLLLSVLLSWMISLYILGINPLLNTWFVNIFSHSVGGF